MKNKILIQASKLKDKKFKIITSIEVFFDYGEISFKSWSNEKQKNEFFSIDNVPEEYLSQYLLDNLNAIVDFNSKINAFNIYTEDFHTFTLNNTNIVFKDNNYYLIPEAISSIISIHEAISNDDIKTLLSFEKDFKKYCEVKKLTIFDYYFIITGKQTNFYNKMFYFRDLYNSKYDFIKELENKYNINIIIKDKKITLNFPNTDVVKSYPEKDLNKENVTELILSFLNIVNSNKKLLQYIKIYEDCNLKNCYIAKSYGFGVYHYYNYSFDEDIKYIAEKLSEQNISFKNEYSDKNFIYRFKIKIK